MSSDANGGDPNDLPYSERFDHDGRPTRAEMERQDRADTEFQLGCMWTAVGVVAVLVLIVVIAAVGAAFNLFG